MYLLLWLLFSSLEYPSQGKEGKSHFLWIVQTVEYNCGPEDKVETRILLLVLISGSDLSHIMPSLVCLRSRLKREVLVFSPPPIHS